MNAILLHRIGVLLTVVALFLSTEKTQAQSPPTDLTDADPATQIAYGATVANDKAVFCFDGRVVRYSLNSRQLECELFDLRNLPSMNGARGQPGFLRFSDDCSWMMLDHSEKSGQLATCKCRP